MVPELIEIRKILCAKDWQRNGREQRGKTPGINHCFGVIVIALSSSVCLSVWSSWCLYHHCVVTIAQWSGCNSPITIIISCNHYQDKRYQSHGATISLVRSTWYYHHSHHCGPIIIALCDDHSIIITMVQRSSR